MSPGSNFLAEKEKLDRIYDISLSLLALNKTKSQLMADHTRQMQEKCDLLKRNRIQEYKNQRQELDAKERELCRKTNQLAAELVDTSDDTPFQKALIKILGNLKGIFFFFQVRRTVTLLKTNLILLTILLSFHCSWYERDEE